MSKPGYIYIATQKGRPSNLKVGKTINVSQREGTLSGSAIADIKIIKSVQVNDMDAVESAFHKILKHHLAPYKGQNEWFNIELELVLPMLRCVGNPQERPQVQEAEIPAPSSMASGRGNWHEDGWRMHCRGETQAQIAKKFGVSEGAVVAMKKKMRDQGRGDEEANRRQRPVTGTGRKQRTTTSDVSNASQAFEAAAQSDFHNVRNSSTTIIYKRRWLAFAKWCESNERSNKRPWLPANPEHIVGWLEANWPRFAAQSLTHDLTAIKLVHKAHGYPDPVSSGSLPRKCWDRLKQKEAASGDSDQSPS